MVLEQIGLAAVFYFTVVLLFRIAGKRFAGQTTTFDLVILISLGVALQNVTLLKGSLEAAIFVATVFTLHWLVAQLCLKSKKARDLIRGRPRALVTDGEILPHALRCENLTIEELKAGLRKMGIDDVSQVRTAYLEETGQISAVKINC